jgi:hypothetical protein
MSLTGYTGEEGDFCFNYRDMFARDFLRKKKRRGEL